jgi:hypothetical protein
MSLRKWQQGGDFGEQGEGVESSANYLMSNGAIELNGSITASKRNCLQVLELTGN